MTITITLATVLWVIAGAIALGFISMLWSKPWGLFILLLAAIAFMLCSGHIGKSGTALPLGMISAFLALILLIQWIQAVGEKYEKKEKTVKPPTIGPPGASGSINSYEEPKYGERK